MESLKRLPFIGPWAPTRTPRVCSRVDLFLGAGLGILEVVGHIGMSKSAMRFIDPQTLSKALDYTFAVNWRTF